MKTGFLFLVSSSLACALFLSACSEKKESSTEKNAGTAMNDAVSNNSSGNVLSAPADYLGAAVKAKQSAVKTIDTTALNSAIQQFYVGEGRFPNDLNELVSKKYIPQIPSAPVGMKIEYDKEGGQVKVVRQ